MRIADSKSSRALRSVFNFSCLLLFLAIIPTAAHAATRTWDGGGGDNNWNTIANWDGDVSLPGGADDVVFDGTSSKNVTINIIVIVRSITITAAYSGIITQNAVTVNATVGGYSQAGGTFTASASNLLFESFNLSGGTFTSTSGSLITDTGFVQSGGTFNHNNGTVVIADGTATVTPQDNLYNFSITDTLFDDSVITITSSFTVENNFTSSKSGDNIDEKYVGGVGNPVVTVLGNLSFPSAVDGDTFFQNSLSIVLHGNFSISDSDVSLATPITFTGTNAQTISRTAGSVSGAWTINKASNDVTAITNFIATANLTMTSGDFDAGTNQVQFGAFTQNAGLFTGGTNTVTFGSFDLTNGTFDSTTGTLVVNGNFEQSGGTFDHSNATVNIGASVTLANVIDPIDNFYNLTLSGFNDDGYIVTFNTSLTIENNLTASSLGGNTDGVLVQGVGNPTITVNGNLSFPSAGSADFGFENSFSIDLLGNFSIADSDTAVATPIEFTGTNAQTISRTAGSVSGAWTINKASNDVTAISNFITSSNLTMTSGDFDAGTYQVQFGAFTQNAGLFSGGTNTVTFRSFELVAGTFDSTSGTLVVNGDFEQSGGTFDHSSATVNIAPSVTFTNLVDPLDNFYNLTLSGYNDDGYIVTFNSSFTVENNLTASSLGDNFDEIFVQGIGNPTITVNGNLSFPNAGSADFAFENSFSIDLLGNFSIADSDTAVATPIEFTGTNAQTISQTAGSASGAWTINKASNSVTPTTNFIKSGAITIDSGTLSANNFNITAGSIVINNGGVLQLRGNETITSPTSNTGGRVRFTGDGDTAADTYTVSSLATSFYTLEIDSADGVTDSFILGNDITINGNFELDAGTFDVTAAGCGGATRSCNMAVRGNWIRNATFMQRTGTVTFDGSGAQTINDSNTWYGLAITAADPRTVNFESGATQTVLANGSLTLAGSGCDVLTLAPATAATDWFIAVANGTVTQTVTRMSVSYSDATGFAIDANDGTVTDGGNNTNWTFGGVPGACGPQPVISSSESSPTNASPIPITIQFSEVVIGFAVGDLSVGNGSAGNFVAVDGDTYTADITPTGQGAVTVDIAAAAAANGDGDDNLAATQFSITFDSVAPTVSISSAAPNPTNTTPFSVTIEFSENVTGFVVGEITVGNGTAGNFAAVDGNTYTADITPTGQGAVTVDVAGAVAADAAGNDNTAAAQFSRTFDSVVPTVAISSAEVSPTNTTPFEVTFEFSENVTGFVVGDITLGNCSIGNFAAVDGNTYTADITPTAQGLVTVNVAAGRAQDSAGNNNTAAPQFSITFDSAAPSVAISSAASNPTNSSPFSVTFQFSETVTGFVVGDITVGNGNAGNFAAVDGDTYTADITPAGQGAVTVDVGGSVAIDAAGNNNTAATQLTRTYDSVQPTVAISSAAANPTNTTPFSVTIEFSENVTGFVVGEITVGNGTAGTFVAVDGNTYTANITPTGQGAVTVDVAGAVAQDSAGNNNTAAAQLTRTFDSVAPTVAISSAEVSPTNTTPFEVTFEFSENVTGFVVGDITVGNGSAGNFAAVDGNSYTADITPTGQGAVTVNVAGARAQDAAGNNNTAAPQFSITFDSAAPTVAISSALGSPTNVSPIPITIEFNENVTGFLIGDLTVGNGNAGNFVAVDGNTYTADITPVADGAVTVDIAGSVAVDGAGNDNTAAAQFSITYSPTAPTVVISTTAPNPTNTSPIPVTFQFSEDVSGFVVGDIVVGNGTAGNFVAVDTDTYTADITPTAQGAVTVDLPTGAAQDVDTNDNIAATQLTRTYDSVLPTVAITSSSTTPTNDSPFPITIEFSENVSGFVIGEITVTNASVGNFVAVDGNTYTASVTPSAQGSVTVNVAAGVAQDAATNSNSAAPQFSITYDSTRPSVVISSAVTDPTNTSPIPITIEFSENVSGFAIGDLALTNAAAGNFVAVDGNSYTANITPTANATITVNIAAAVAQDAAGNTNTAAAQFSRSFNSSRPTVAITSTATSPTSTSPIPVTFTFSRSVSGFTLGDITVTNGAASGFVTVSATTYRASITPTADGAVRVNVAAGRATDAFGNTNLAAPQFSITYQRFAGQTFSASGKLFYQNELGAKTLFFEEDSRSSQNADNDAINDIWVEAYRHSETGSKILVDRVKVRRTAGGNGVSSFTFPALPATPTNSDGTFITRTVEVKVGSDTQQVEQVVGSFTFVIRAYDNYYSVSRNYQLDLVDNRVDTDPTSPRFGQKLLGCSASDVGSTEWVETSSGTVRKDSRCLFDPLVLDQNISQLDQVVNGCVHDSDANGIIIERKMGQDRTCHVTRDRNDPDEEFIPTNPVNLTATQGSRSNGVLLSWDASERVDYYRIYRSQYSQENSGFATRYEELSSQNRMKALAQLEFKGDVIKHYLVPTEAQQTTVTFLDQTAIPGVHYDYVVRAHNPAGTSAYSNLAEGWRYSSSSTTDSDGDGASDGEEDDAGTDIDDPGSFPTRLKSPAFVKYNTFLNQYNWLELLSAGSKAVKANIRIYDSQGQVLREVGNIVINSYKQLDLDIHSLVPPDTYGVVRIDFNSQATGVELQGRMSNFRLSPTRSNRHSFALTRELKNAVRGVTYATSNSIDPQGSGNLVANWAEIINLDSVVRRFTMRIYDLQGKLLYDSEQAFDANGVRKPSLSVAAYGELDVQAGHEFGEGVYLVEIAPHDGIARYVASVVRYSYKTEQTSTALDFNFALPVQARKGSGEKLYVPIGNQPGQLPGECWSQSNWLEVINTRAVPIAARVKFRNSKGELVGDTTVSLNGLGQQHLNAGALLGANEFGFAEIVPAEAGAIIAQGGKYFHDCTTNIMQSAYLSEARALGEPAQLGSYNTFLGMQNLLRLSNPTGSTVTLNLEVLSSQNYLEKEYRLEPYSSAQLDLSNSTEFGTTPDSYGVVVLSTTGNGRFVAENTRQRVVDGSIDYALPTPLQ